MKRKSAWLSFTACALTAAATLAPVQAEPAASPVPDKTVLKTDFSNVQVIAFPNGQVGLFEKSTGKLYIYNEGLTNCYIVLKISQLGQPFERISPAPAPVAPRSELPPPRKAE